MKYDSRSKLAALVALSLAACQPDAPIGADGEGNSVCDHPRTTSDCYTEGIALAICAMASVCHVCVESVDGAGRPITWGAVESPVACGCGTPHVIVTSDGGDAPPADAPPADAPPADAPPADAPPADAPPADAPACAEAVGTFDCGTEGIAQTICASVRGAGRPCHVCVQRADVTGAATSWSALESPESCGCPPVQRDTPVDAGVPGCSSNADCRSDQVCEFALGCGHTRGECHDRGCESLPVAPQYCGCDGRTIQQVSACLPSRPYAATGACPDGGVPHDA